MAKLSITGRDELTRIFTELGAHADGMAKACVYEGAKVVADRIKQNLNGLPVDTWRPKNTTTNGPYDVLTATNKQDLLTGFGIGEITLTGNGAETKIGFAGYGSAPSKKYPKGLPNGMLARSIESGTSARRAHPFVRPAVNATKGEAQEAMSRKGDDFMKKLID